MIWKQKYQHPATIITINKHSLFDNNNCAFARHCNAAAPVCASFRYALRRTIRLYEAADLALPRSPREQPDAHLPQAYIDESPGHEKAPNMSSEMIEWISGPHKASVGVYEDGLLLLSVGRRPAGMLRGESSHKIARPAFGVQYMVSF
jgi:hypothetical protein